MSKYGLRKSQWLPDWARENGYKPDELTTVNDVLMDKGWGPARLAALKKKYPDYRPKPLPGTASNRQPYLRSDWDTFLEMVEGLENAPPGASPPAKAAPAAPAASKPAAGTAVKLTGPVGTLVKTNAWQRQRYAQQLHELEQVRKHIAELTTMILDVDSGNGASGQEVCAKELEEVEREIKRLQDLRRELAAKLKRISRHTVDDLPRLRDIAWGTRAQVNRTHRKIMLAEVSVEQLELPLVPDTPQSDQLLRELAAGRLVTLDGGCTRLGVLPRNLQTARAAHSQDFPPSMGKHPGNRADLYEFAAFKRFCEDRCIAYVDREDAIGVRG